MVDQEHGTIDSPLHPDQVELMPDVPKSLEQLTSAGYALCVVSNQPAAAKGKTTQSNLQNVHDRILQLAGESGGKIDHSYICFHRSEDHCRCRKPKTGLLEDALKDYPDVSRSQIWMVGDGITDIQAGAALKLHTVYLGPKKSDAHRLFVESQCLPDEWSESLSGFVQTLLKPKLK